MKPIFFFLFPLLLCYSAYSQKDSLSVELKTDSKDWLAKVGDSICFEVVVKKHGNIVDNCSIKYEIAPDMMPAMYKDSIPECKGYFKSSKYTLNTPGFLRCMVEVVLDRKPYKRLCTVGFDTEMIRPTVDMPKDFLSFWEKNKAELAALPIDAQMQYLPEKSTDSVNAYMVSFQNIYNTRIYGMLCIPKQPGKYPAILEVPGAGVRPYSPNIKLAARGVIVLTIGIHGIPVNMDSSVYVDLAKGALRGYYYDKVNSKEAFYYRRVYLGCIRANDFLTSLPLYDGAHLAVTGGSQGGALSIVTAALDKRVKYLAAFYPALSDMTGYLYNRAGGWPHIFSPQNVDYLKILNLKENMSYYDVVNFAQMLSVPGYYSFGYNDIVCPPTSVFASLNSISAPKTIKIYKETGHWAYPVQKEESLQWLLDELHK